MMRRRRTAGLLRHVAPICQRRDAVPHRSTLALACLLATLATGPVHAASGEGLCRGAFDYIAPPPDVRARALGEDQPTYIAADETAGDPEGVMELRGNASVVRGDRYLTAESLRYDRPGRTLDATGGVVFGDTRALFESSAIHYDIEHDRGTLENASYALREKRARGRARRVIRRDASTHRLEEALYTTCPPGEMDWRLRAREVDLDFDAGHGVARGVKVDLLGLPLLYTPYISFPLSDARRSGLLFPSVGNTDTGGLEVRVPYYLNLAPNYDMTVAPRYMDERGAMLESTFRYLLPFAEGELSGAYLSGDDLAERDRSALFWRSQGHFTPRWRHYVDVNRVSDDAYFEDFGDDLAETSVTHLRRRGETTYEGDTWLAMARAETFQTLTGTRPYGRLPQLYFHSGRAGLPLGLSYGLDLESVRFDHPDFVDGARFDLYPSVALPLNRPAWHVEPRVGYRYTQYDLDGQPPGLDDNPSRGAPIASLDAGVAFERDAALWGRGAVQTLEPRLFYLYIPRRDQDDIPLFDTSLYDFRFDSLFRHDRFTGADRLGDANQLTTALTSRLLSPTSGIELGRVSLGQIQYFRNREVGLVPGSFEETDAASALVGEIYALLTRALSLTSDIEWDPDDQRTERMVAAVRWRPDAERYAHLSYRLRRDIARLAVLPGSAPEALEQVDLGVIWPLRDNWTLIGRGYYSLRNDQTLETLLGVGYETCCWGARLVQRRYVRDESGDLENAILFQVELKGLASVGTRIDEFLSESIRGYEPPPVP
jgi:LPS-assembly protein